MIDPFRVLGIPHSSSREEIKRAYRKLAKALHPDTRPDKEEASRLFQELTSAFDLAMGGWVPPKPEPNPEPPPSRSQSKPRRHRVLRDQDQYLNGQLFIRKMIFPKEIFESEFPTWERMVMLPLHYLEEGCTIRLNDQLDVRVRPGTRTGTVLRFKDGLELKVVADSGEAGWKTGAFF